MKRVKDDLDQYVEMRLVEWASWYAGNVNCIGFSKKNILAKMHDADGMLDNVRSSTTLIPNLNAEEIEKLYSYLFLYNKKCAEVLKIHYHFPHDSECKVKKSRYSKNQYYHHLQLAHEWLKGFFYARKKFI